MTTRLVLFALGILLGGLVTAAAEGLDFINFTDSLSDADLRKLRNEKRAELQHMAATTSPEKTAEGTVYRIFYCTVYYTPKESGFTTERGFDVTPVTAPGLGGRKYPRSFLHAVKREGFGRMEEPVNQRNYMQYRGNGRYGFAKAPLGSRGNVLVARKSCAVSGRNSHLRQKMKFRIKSDLVEQVMGSSDWEVADTGGGIHPLQIDLYWGEDEPMGAVGRQEARPAGTRMEYAFEVKVVTE
jgi:hypothetical protein